MKYYSFLLVLLFTKTAFGDTHILELKPGNWLVKPSLFYIVGFVDERTDKEKLGVALINEKPVQVKFRKSIEKDLMELIDFSVVKDTSLIPLKISIKKFELNETGSIMNHKASLDFEFEIFREVGGKRYKIYESKGTPVLTMKGPFENPHEQNIGESLKHLVTNFNNFINTSPNQPALAKSVRVIPEIRIYKGDTITWSADYKLKWSDFKGKSIDDGYMAQSNCVFDYRLEPVINKGVLELHLYLVACFEKTTSWVKSDAKTIELLEHEQVHFDICEMFIRDIRKKMMAATFPNFMEYDTVLNAILDKGWNDYQAEQQRYDAETQHGVVPEKQEAWEKRVQSFLK